MERKNGIELGRRDMLMSAAGLAALPLASGAAAQGIGSGGQRDATARPAPTAGVNGRRRLGKLEVSSIGIGVQNNARKYTTETPYRPEQVDLLRRAFDRGVTFFDCAEAYGPQECERILGEAVQPFRNRVVITSKFGWDIDLQTGQRRPGLNSRPEHIKLAVEGSLKRLRTDRIDSPRAISERRRPAFPRKTCPTTCSW